LPFLIAEIKGESPQIFGADAEAGIADLQNDGIARAYNANPNARQNAQFLKTGGENRIGSHARNHARRAGSAIY